ncbi:MAG TPA: aminotransferase class V-fold PLP-dependent enzyme, partial [Homoserinimonas sp.]|nr:aminotransferase class V-fold PLP-dependent enzyme [Homoserinimonas sp.]
WLDTPGSPPGARPVLASVRAALDAWERGDFSWTDWDGVPDRARAKLATLLGTSPELVALVGSLSEAAATVSRVIPAGGKVLVASNEFRSNLFPWLALESRGVQVLAPPEGSTETLTDRICASLVDGVSLVAVSSVVSSTGARPDLDAITTRARAVGARVFLNVTQSFGVLPLDLARLQPDYLAAHAYKWMLAPRGCAWLSVRSDRLAELEPIAPGWHSVDSPNQDYNGVRPLSNHASRLDGGLPWLPWIGGDAALDILLAVDPEQVGAHALGLARKARSGLEDLGVAIEGIDLESHIVRVYSPHSSEIVRRLRSDGVMASGSDQALRIGIHGFNNTEDIDRFLAGVDHVIRGGSSSVR